MDRQSKNLMDELDSYINQKDKHLIIEARASNIIVSALNLMDLISENYSEDESAELSKRLVNSIKNRDPSKFKRKIREYRKHEDKKNVHKK